MKSGIYQILNTITGLIYIGSAVHFQLRWNCHKSELRNNKHANKRLQNSWNKYGEGGFKFEILEQVLDKTRLLEREQLWINWTLCYQREFGFNICKIAGNSLGVKATEETKAKIRLANIGKKLSEEHKAKLVIGSTGKFFSEERRRKISKSKIGKRREDMKGNQYTKGTKLSEDHKKKISKGLKGRDESYKRKSDKWPHGSRCICRECKEKRTNLYNIWKNKVMPFVMVNANV